MGKKKGKKIKIKAFISVLLIVISLVITLLFFSKAVLNLRITDELIRFLIAITLSMAGFGIIAFQISKEKEEIRKNFFDFSIVMVSSGLAGIAYLAYPNFKLENFNLGNLSTLLFIWGVFLLLCILIEERFIRKLIE